MFYPFRTLEVSNFTE